MRQKHEMFRPAACLALMAVTEEPIMLQDALVSEHAASWKTAWESELESLKKNGTWVIELNPKTEILWDKDGCLNEKKMEGLRFA